MIVVAGTPTEGPVELLLARCAELGIEVVLLDEERAADWQLEVGINQGLVSAHAVHLGNRIDLSEATGLYLRLTAPTAAGLRGDPLREARRLASVALLASWGDVAPLRVANRPRMMSSNSSKPYQAALIRAQGFGVPETIVTSDPAAVRLFQAQYGRVIYKSTSGVRSIVHELAGQRFDDLERVRALPTQFQRMLTGVNVRVHVVGTEVHACEVDSAAVDYRYADGGPGAGMRAVALPEAILERSIALSQALGLPFAGIDLHRERDGRWWCFEVNPSPAYNCFEEPTGLPIARSLAIWLAGNETA